MQLGRRECGWLFQREDTLFIYSFCMHCIINHMVSSRYRLLCVKTNEVKTTLIASLIDYWYYGVLTSSSEMFLLYILFSFFTNNHCVPFISANYFFLLLYSYPHSPPLFPADTENQNWPLKCFGFSFISVCFPHFDFIFSISYLVIFLWYLISDSTSVHILLPFFILSWIFLSFSFLFT